MRHKSPSKIISFCSTQMVQYKNQFPDKVWTALSDEIGDQSSFDRKRQQEKKSRNFCKIYRKCGASNQSEIFS